MYNLICQLLEGLQERRRDKTVSVCSLTSLNPRPCGSTACHFCIAIKQQTRELEEEGRNACTCRSCPEALVSLQIYHQNLRFTWNCPTVLSIYICNGYGCLWGTHSISHLYWAVLVSANLNRHQNVYEKCIHIEWQARPNLIWWC